MRSHRVDIIVAAIGYFALAQAAFALVGRRSVLGVPQDVANVALLLTATIVFITLAARTARRPTPDWLRRTIMASAMAAMLGALAHTISLGFQVRWGGRCNQCTPFVFMVEVTLISGLVAAAAALPVGMLARRPGTEAN